MTEPTCTVCHRPPHGVQLDGSVRYIIRQHPPIHVRQGTAACQRRIISGKDFDWCPGVVEIVEARVTLRV